MESKLFEYWRFNGGAWHNGPRKGDPIPVRDTAVGKIVILTTRKRAQGEGERKIIGMYEIGEVDSKGNLNAHRDFRIRLRAAEAAQLNFWRYYRNDSSDVPMWGTMLFRYLDDSQVHRILTDAEAVVGDSYSKEVIHGLILRKFGDAVPVPPCGALSDGYPVDKRVALARKYPGGEGPNHLALKNWVADHPSYIGLPSGSVAHVEHLFKSGDCVDIAFKLPNGNWVAVEIETTTPFPGAHQVIKYRSLLAAQQGWDLDTSRVRGTLVAWSYAAADLAFCARYGIEAWYCRHGQRGLLQSCP